jgi:hypothetical protein
MNTTMMPIIAKILRALSILFLSLDMFWIAIPLLRVLVNMIEGTHDEMGVMWVYYLRWAISLVLVGAVLFSCHRFSRCDKRGSLATGLLWCVAFVTGIYGVLFTFTLSRVMVQH